MKGIIVKVRFRNIRAMALFPFILTTTDDPEVINHERIHLRQQVELLIIPFYLWYGIEFLVYRIMGYGRWNAYYKISFEREAHENDRDMQYLHNRKAFGFLKYMK